MRLPHPKISQAFIVKRLLEWRQIHVIKRDKLLLLNLILKNKSTALRLIQFVKLFVILKFSFHACVEIETQFELRIKVILKAVSL